MSKISFAWPNLASLQGESPFFIYITGTRRFSWNLRSRQKPPFFIPQELQDKAVPEVLLIWQREGGRKKSRCWHYYCEAFICTVNHVLRKRHQWVREQSRDVTNSSRPWRTRLAKIPLAYPLPIWSKKWRMKPSSHWEDTDTSPQNEPLLSLQGWCRLSNMMKIMWWKKSHWTNLSGMLSLTPRALCEHH